MGLLFEAYETRESLIRAVLEYVSLVKYPDGDEEGRNYETHIDYLEGMICAKAREHCEQIEKLPHDVRPMGWDG